MTTVVAIAEKLNQAGVPPRFAADISRLLLRVMRELSEGHPVPNERAHRIVAELGVDDEESEQFLRSVTERSPNDDIVGMLGLSLNENWAHRFVVGKASLRTWCAWDTLFIPLLIGRTATIESDSPVTGATIRAVVSPEGATEVDPEDAVVSVVVLDSEVGSVEEAWSQFCHQVYFFGSRDEAEEWATARSNIEILTVEEAFELGRHAWSSVLAHA